MKDPHITVIVDNPNSWFQPYATRLVKLLRKHGYEAKLTRSVKNIKKGGIAVFLSCEEIVKRKTMDLSVNNIVVHSSNLPKGRGMSPLTWQIEGGKNEVVNTLFEMTEGIDEGVIYLQEKMKFKGHELIDELRKVQGESIIRLVTKFVSKHKNLKGRKQSGEPTYFPRRKPSDSKLDVNKSIREQFNRLRVVDNDRYPATFKYKNHSYTLKVFKNDSKS